MKKLQQARTLRYTNNLTNTLKQLCHSAHSQIYLYILLELAAPALQTSTTTLKQTSRDLGYIKTKLGGGNLGTTKNGRNKRND